MDVNIRSGLHLPIDHQLVDAALSRSRKRYHDRDGGRPEGFANGNRHQGPFYSLQLPSNEIESTDRHGYNSFG